VVSAGASPYRAAGSLTNPYDTKNTNNAEFSLVKLVAGAWSSTEALGVRGHTHSQTHTHIFIYFHTSHIFSFTANTQHEPEEALAHAYDLSAACWRQRTTIRGKINAQNTHLTTASPTQPPHGESARHPALHSRPTPSRHGLAYARG
jgi:hypothetical protein